jgi:anti-sigma28 factor (negative regulator of flagellin synthesis)
VQVLHERIRDGEYAMNQADLALALAEQQLDGLREDAR